MVNGDDIHTRPNYCRCRIIAPNISWDSKCNNIGKAMDWQFLWERSKGISESEHFHSIFSFTKYISLWADDRSWYASCESEIQKLFPRALLIKQRSEGTRKLICRELGPRKHFHVSSKLLPVVTLKLYMVCMRINVSEKVVYMSCLCIFLRVIVHDVPREFQDLKKSTCFMFIYILRQVARLVICAKIFVKHCCPIFSYAIIDPCIWSRLVSGRS